MGYISSRYFGNLKMRREGAKQVADGVLVGPVIDSAAIL